MKLPSFRLPARHRQAAPYVKGNAACRRFVQLPTRFLVFLVARIACNHVLFVPCIIDHQFTTLNRQNAQTCSLDIYVTLLHVSVRDGPS